MCYTVTMGCGCQVYVSCHPRTNVAHTRVIERRGTRCGVRQHEIGFRLQLWEMLAESEVGHVIEKERVDGSRDAGRHPSRLIPPRLDV